MNPTCQLADRNTNPLTCSLWIYGQAGWGHDFFGAWMTGRKGSWTPESQCRPSTCKMKVSITNHFAGDHVSLQRGCHFKSWCPWTYKQLALSQTHRTGVTYWFLGLRAPSPPPPHRLLTTGLDLFRGKNCVVLLDPSPSNAHSCWWIEWMEPSHRSCFKSFFSSMTF